MFQYRGDCSSNPFQTTSVLIDVIDRAKEITKVTFFRRCLLVDGGKALQSCMRNFPGDYTYWKSSYRGKPVYFYEWSRIEFFYF